MQITKPVRRALAESAEFEYSGQVHARLAVLERTFPVVKERFEIWVTVNREFWFKNSGWTFLTEAEALAAYERILPSYVGS